MITMRISTARRLLLCVVDGLVLAAVLVALWQAAIGYPAELCTALAFGALSAVPAALLVLLTSSRNRESERDEDERWERYHNGREVQLPAYPYPPPAPPRG